MSGSAAVVESVGRIRDRGGDVDERLREVVAALVASGGCGWAGILFAEAGELVLGPEAGTPTPDSRIRAPVVYGEARVAELLLDGAADRTLAEQVAPLIADLCLVGWDTGGIPWEETG